jgi:hypothetical protein
MEKKYSLFGVGVLFILISCFYWKNHVSETACKRIPIRFSPSKIPIFDVVIEGTTYPLGLDLGSKFPLSLEPAVLKNISKKRLGKSEWFDGKGNYYTSRSYLIPEIDICGFLLKNITVRENLNNYQAVTTMWHAKDDPLEPENLGVLGRPLLEKANLCLDLSHNAFFICSDLEMLQRKGICPKVLVKTPFEIYAGMMTLPIETDFGKKHFVLDTGCTVTLIRSSLVQNQDCQNDWRELPFCTTSSFAINGKNFGSQDLYLFDLDPHVQKMEGVLGMDFLKEHVIYIDYPNKAIYIGESEPNPLYISHRNTEE